MPRGGYRVGAGGKPTWKHGRTKTIRVPESLAERVLEIARTLDEQVAEDKAPSKMIDLAGVAIVRIGKDPAVRLIDLLRAGYQLQPERLIRSLKSTVEDDLKRKGDLESLIEEFL